MTKFDPRSCTYEEALQNFDQFCDYFDAAARTPRPTENNPGGSPIPDISPSEATVNVQATPQ